MDFPVIRLVFVRCDLCHHALSGAGGGNGHRHGTGHLVGRLDVGAIGQIVIKLDHAWEFALGDRHQISITLRPNVVAPQVTAVKFIDLVHS